MTRTVRMNYQGKEEYAKELWKCWNCSKFDTEAHIKRCPAFSDLRKNKDLDNNEDLVNFFQEVF